MKADVEVQYDESQCSFIVSSFLLDLFDRMKLLYKNMLQHSMIMILLIQGYHVILYCI